MVNKMRQGDVLIVSIESLPAGVKKAVVNEDRVVCQYGEVTGHAHAIKATEVVPYIDSAEDLTITDALSGGGRAFLEVCLGASLTHEEHGTISLAPGFYEVKRQREYQPQALPRWVTD